MKGVVCGVVYKVLVSIWLPFLYFTRDFNTLTFISDYKPTFLECSFQSLLLSYSFYWNAFLEREYGNSICVRLCFDTKQPLNKLAKSLGWCQMLLFFELQWLPMKQRILLSLYLHTQSNKWFYSSSFRLTNTALQSIANAKDRMQFFLRQPSHRLSRGRMVPGRFLFCNKTSKEIPK